MISWSFGGISITCDGLRKILVGEVKDILDNYCEISRQMINFNKSAICESKSSWNERCKALTTNKGSINPLCVG